MSHTELVPADFLPNGLPMPVSNNNQSFDTVADLDTAAPLEGAPATTQPAPISPVSVDNAVNSDPAVLTKVELPPLQHAQEDSCSASDADAPAVTDGSVVGKPDAAANIDVNLPKVDTAAVAGMSAQSLATGAAEDSALSPQQISHTVSRDVTDANETTEATGGVVPITTPHSNIEATGGVVPITKPAAEATGGVVPITTPATEGTGGVVPITASQSNTEAMGGVVPSTTPQSNIEATGGVVPITTPAAEGTGGDEPTTTAGNIEATGGVVLITTPAAEVQQAAQQQLLLLHPASAGTPSIIPDMLLYSGSKQQDAHSLSAQPIQLSGPVVSATTSAADSLVDTALGESPTRAKPYQKEIAERPIVGDLSSPDLEVIMGPEDTIPGSPAHSDGVVASVLPPSAATPSLEGSALVPGSADAGTQQPTDSDKDAMPGR